LTIDEMLAEAERLDEAATDGPWMHDFDAAGDEDGPAVWSESVEGSDFMPVFCSHPYWAREDGDFCAFARTALPALVAEVRRLREEAAPKPSKRVIVGVCEECPAFGFDECGNTYCHHAKDDVRPETPAGDPIGCLFEDGGTVMLVDPWLGES